MPVTTLEDRLGEFYKGLPAPVVQRLKDYGFDAEHGQEIVEGAATALLADPTEIARMMEGSLPVFQQALKTKLRVLGQAGEAMAGDSRPAPEAAPKQTSIEDQYRASIDALRQLMDGKVTLDIIMAVNALPFVVANVKGKEPDLELTMDALRANAMQTSNVAPGGQYKNRVVFAPKQFVPVAADPFSGKALDEGAAHTDVLGELSEDDKMFVAFMRVKGYLHRLGGSLDAQVDAVHDAIINGKRNTTVNQARVEWQVVQNDPASMETLRKSLFVQAPGIRGAASHLDFVIMTEEVKEGTQKLLLSLFSASELRRFVRYLPGGDAIVAVLPEKVSPAELSEAVVEILAKRGTFREAAFWTKLQKERPERYREVVPYRLLILGE